MFLSNGGAMNDRPLLAALRSARAARRAVALVTAIAGAGEFAQQVGRRLLVWPDPNHPVIGDLALGECADQVLADVRQALAQGITQRVRYTVRGSTLHLFIEIQLPPAHLIIAGAGHIAVPLAATAKICEFVVTVLDDRPQYGTPLRFPTADQVIVGPFAAELRRLRSESGPEQVNAFDHNTYLVLVTRGHQHDIDCLLEVLDDPLAYIGMIGSKRRIRAVYDLLERERGIPAAKLSRIYAPIGIDINAQTPAEIAVCIMAEIIKVRRGGAAVSLSDKLRRRAE